MPLVVDSTGEPQGLTDVHCTLAPRTALVEADAGRVGAPRRPKPWPAELTSVRSRRRYAASGLRVALPRRPRPETTEGYPFLTCPNARTNLVTTHSGSA
jgi:hypothetical protein